MRIRVMLNSLLSFNRKRLMDIEPGCGDAIKVFLCVGCEYHDVREMSGYDDVMIMIYGCLFVPRQGIEERERAER